ncbi:hypothetical protein F8388_026652 [Cannabis sativa]|uniref:Sodium/calcium exchanger membrane region domain-containing protein n=1 Tax=Cannabis sativa TaxID=3483 RepID=A0A7J6DRU6_CANSA|nr:hypothetical protein F8388_026652 [Cannabis sativa]KAF4358820.1 hypothetical protein G4B88_023104 [Cannabis sativa]
MNHHGRNDQGSTLNDMENGIVSSYEDDHHQNIINGNNNNKGESYGLLGGKSGCRSPQNMSSSLLRKKSDPILVSHVRFQMLRAFLTNLQEVILGTKLAVLFPAVPLAVAADFYHFGRVIGGLLNATCGNATELIIALFALQQKKIDVVKYSLLGSIISNLLLVLGTSLLCGGLANLKKEQRYDRVIRQTGRCELTSSATGIAMPHTAIDVQICSSAGDLCWKLYASVV